MSISYCENDYLYGKSPDMIRNVNKLKNQLNEEKRNNLITDGKRIEEYYKFINLVAKLICELGIKDNSISYSLLISVLAKKGYFSENKLESSFVTPKYDKYDFLGMDVVAGNCCCRHYAYFHKDIFDILGQFNFLFPCAMGEKNPSNSSANHLVNGIRYNNNMYAYDSYNQLLFGLMNEFEMKSIGSKYEKIIYYKPYADMIFSGVSIDEEKKRISVLKALSALPKISQDELDYIVHETVRNAKLHQDTLSDFKEESKEYIKRILK